MSKFANLSAYNRQKAAVYAAYMIGSSLFHSCRCTNPCEASRLYLHYTEMPEKKQIFLEERMIRDTEKLGFDLLNLLSEMAAEARFRQEEDACFVEFDTGGFESFSISVDGDGKATLRMAG